MTDEEWALVTPYLTVMDRAALQRRHDLREVLDGLRFIVCTGLQWQPLPHDLPPWPAVYQQTRYWLAAGVFEAIIHDLRALLRLAEGRAPEPTTMIFNSGTVRSTPESGTRAGYDGRKRRKGSKAHAAVDTLIHLLALRATPADAEDREMVRVLTEAVHAATGEHVEVAFVDQGYNGKAPAAGEAHGMRLEVVKLSEAKRGLRLAEPLPAPGSRPRRAADNAGRRLLPCLAFTLLAVHRVLPLL